MSLNSAILAKADVSLNSKEINLLLAMKKKKKTIYFEKTLNSKLTIDLDHVN